MKKFFMLLVLLGISAYGILAFASGTGLDLGLGLGGRCPCGSGYAILQDSDSKTIIDSEGKTICVLQ